MVRFCCCNSVNRTQKLYYIMKEHSLTLEYWACPPAVTIVVIRHSWFLDRLFFKGCVEREPGYGTLSIDLRRTTLPDVVLSRCRCGAGTWNAAKDLDSDSERLELQRFIGL